VGISAAAADESLSANVAVENGRRVDGIVQQAKDAGIGWFAPDCWGEDTDGDP
jgi:hypothetical protein